MEGDGDAAVIDTPIGFAQQVIQDAEVALKADIRLSEPQRRQYTLARAYLERVEELRKYKNGYNALQHDLAIYKAMASGGRP